MAEQLKPMAVNPGDPVTSELMANLVSNINIINSMSNSTVTANANGDAATTTQTVIESGRIKVPANAAGTGKKDIPFTKIFTARPNVVCTIWQPSSNNFLKHKYQPVVTEVSVNGFTVRMMPIGTPTGGDVWVQWVAVS